MANESLKTLIQQGLGAMKEGTKIAAEATDDLKDDVTNSQLKAALEQGNQQSKQWATRIERSFEAAGGKGEEENPILEAHYKVSKIVRGSAEDDYSRDLGIIASGQLALHYWIASFGTLQSYAAQSGLSQVAQDMKDCLAEAKQADEQHTAIAKQILGAN
ncbi:MAG: ferritin-like domain-containing protein [Janthinobacterium lividum]